MNKSGRWNRDRTCVCGSTAKDVFAFYQHVWNSAVCAHGWRHTHTHTNASSSNTYCTFTPKVGPGGHVHTFGLSSGISAWITTSPPFTPARQNSIWGVRMEGEGGWVWWICTSVSETSVAKNSCGLQQQQRSQPVGSRICLARAAGNAEVTWGAPWQEGSHPPPPAAFRCYHGDLRT